MGTSVFACFYKIICKLLDNFISVFSVSFERLLRVSFSMAALLLFRFCRSHITHLFENDRHFSHLSTLEREMAFRTEMVSFHVAFDWSILEISTC